MTTERFDVDLKRRGGQFLPVRLLHRVAFSSAGLPGPSRTLALNRAPGEDAGEDLRAAEVRFARFFNATPMAIASVAADGGVLRANGAFARLAPAALKPPAGEARPSLYAGVAERDHAALREALAAASAGKGDVAPVDLDARRASRRARPASSSRRPPIRRATKAPARPCSRSTPPSSGRCRRASSRARRCRRSASSPAASPTTSTTC